VLWLCGRDWVEAVTHSFLARPHSLSDWQAMRLTLTDVVGSLARSRPGLLLCQRTVAFSPSHCGRTLDHQDSDIQELAKAVATRRCLRQPDQSCMLVAMISLLTYRRALDVWLEGPVSRAPVEVFAEEFRLLSDLLSRP